MEPSVLVALALQGVKLATGLLAQVNAARGALSSTDEATLKDALAGLQKENDALYASVQDKLAAAAEEG